MCRTGGRRCPSSKRTGADLEAHNKHRREMYAAKKAQDKLESIVARWKQEDAELVKIPTDAKVDDVKEYITQTEPVAIIPGKAADTSIKDDPQVREQHLSYQKAADELLGHFTKRGKVSLPSKWGAPDAEAMMKSLGEGDDKFVYLGAGIDKIAYYHKKTGLVYKVFYSQGHRANSAAGKKRLFTYMDKYIRREQMLIAEIDEDKLQSNNVRYATNYYFTTSDGYPVIAQEYLPDERYEKYDFCDNIPLWIELDEQGFMDMHIGNVRRDKETGESVMFDCLQICDDILEEME